MSEKSYCESEVTSDSSLLYSDNGGSVTVGKSE
jgi:hypothetical protein